MKNSLSAFFCLIFLSSLFFLSSPAHAVPHISGKRIAGEVRDSVHQLPDLRALKAQNLSPAAIRKAIGATGTKKVAVVICQFPSLGSYTSGYPNILSTSTIKADLDRMASFFSEVSYGQLTLAISVSTTVYTAAQSMSYYGEADGAGNEGGDLLIQEMIGKAGVVKGTGPGQFDAVIVIHAGNGNESTNTTGDIWSAFYTFGIKNGFTEGLISAELENGGDPFGVYCHEFGHQLGLPDLYATDGRESSSQVGSWCLMDMGVWLNDGADPSHPNAWCKQLLGWVTPSTLATIARNVSLSPVETFNSAVTIPIPTATDPATEYFLVEYRSKTAGTFDTALAGQGVLIWHIDEGPIDGTSLADRYQLNSINNYSRGTVALVPAGSTSPKVTGGDALDPWPGSKQVFTTPDSDSYNGMTSGVYSAGFAFAGGIAGFSVAQIAATSVVSIDRIVNYPNPAGPSYPVSASKPSGTLTTLAFYFSKAPVTLHVTIYNTAGEKVKDIPKEQMTFNPAPSGDYKWVYEYNWDGRNDGGENVAPGLYLYRIVAEGKTRIGKLAITR